METAPVSHSGDAADDPAVWVHPTDPARSVRARPGGRGRRPAAWPPGRRR
ncbi:phytase [Streptomyces sp. NPDC085612]